MKLEVIQSILEENRRGYNQIAEQFSLTRKFPWRLFELFKPYLQKNQSVLDAGCGSGRLYEFIKGKNISYTGLDASGKLIDLAKKNYPGVDFQIGDITELPFPDNSFDAVFCVAALHHLPGKELRSQAIKEFRRVLKPGGYLIMTNWNIWNLKWWPAILLFSLKKITGQHQLGWGDVLKPWKDSYGRVKTSRYLHAFTKRELKKILSKNGFEVLENYYTSHDAKKVFVFGYNLLTIAEKSLK